MSMAGMSSDQTDAAIMTPAANPRKTCWKDALISPRKKKTTAAPSAVIKNVNPVPIAADRTGCNAFIITTASLVALYYTRQV